MNLNGQDAYAITGKEKVVCCGCNDRLMLPTNSTYLLLCAAKSA